MKTELKLTAEEIAHLTGGFSIPAEECKPEKNLSRNFGGSTNYYELPPRAADLQDLIEYKKMDFSRGNIFKAAYRLGENGEDPRRDLNKIIWFATRMLQNLPE